MKEKISSELIRQHNIDLERQEAVAHAFRLEAEIKDLQEQKNSELHKYCLAEKQTNELLTMREEDFSSFLWNHVKTTHDVGTDVEDLEKSNQHKEVSKKTQKANAPSIRIPQAKSTKGMKSKEGVEEMGNIIDDEESVDDFPEAPISTSSASRRTSLKSQKAKISGPSPTNRRMSEIHKAPPSLGERSSKAPSPTKGRRGSEFFPHTTKGLTSPTHEIVASPKSNLILSTKALEQDGRSFPSTETEEAKYLPTKPSIPKISPIPTESSRDEFSPLPDNTPSTSSARHLASYRTKIKSPQGEVSRST